MTTQDFKRLAWRKKQARKRTVKLLGTMFMLMFALFVIPAIACSIDNPSDALEASTTLVAAGGMVMIGNIEDSSDRDAAGEQISYEVFLISTDQIDKSKPFPKPNMNREIGDLPLKAGERMYSFECHIAPTDDGKGEKGDFNSTFSGTIVLAMSGNRDQLMDFCEQFTGKKFIIIYQDSETGNYFIAGDILKPMTLKSFERANNKEKRGVTMTFENSSYRQPHKYVGVIVRTEPITLAAGAAILAIVSGNDAYIAPNGTDAATPITSVSGLTVNDKGRTITVRGEGSDKAATIEDGAVFVLEGGVTWTGKSGSALTLRVLDTSRLVEVGGTRIQTI